MRFSTLFSVFMAVALCLSAPNAVAQGLPTGGTQQTAPTDTDPLSALAETLEDPAARDRLIAALRQANESDAAAAAPQPVLSLAERIAASTVEAVNSLAEQIAGVVRDIGQLGVLPGLLDEDRLGQIRDEGVGLALTVIVTVLIYRGLRIVSRRVRFGAGPTGADLSSRILAFAAQIVLRVASVVLAWVAGYGLATFVLTNGGIALPQALYLNAFLAFGMFSVALSLLVSRHPDDLTFASLPVDVERVIYRNVRNIFGVLFYGLIAAVPIVQGWTNLVVGRSLRIVLITAVAILAIVAVRRIRKVLDSDRDVKRTVSEPVGGKDDTLSDDIATGTQSLWSRLWPMLAYGYVAVAYLVALANPSEIVPLVGRATLMSAVALVAVLMGLRLLSTASGDLRIPVPRSLGQLLPSLSERMSGFLSPLCVLGAGVLFIAAILLILEGWRVADVSGWLSSGGSDLMWRLATALLILATLAVAWAILTSWIDRRLAADVPGKAVSARSRTLLALFRNAVTIALVVFGGMTALSELGVDIAPLLAGAGVIGLAVGFGAQKLVQDIITGVFIQLENAINEGDVVTVAGITGGVERLTIRSVGIRDLSGVYHLIPFSAVDTVGNYMRLFGYHVEVVGISYDSDIDTAEAAMHDAFDTLKEGPLGPEIIAPLEYHGVVGLGDSAVNLRARIKTRPGQQWAVGRAYTREVKRALDAAGVEIPFPHRELKLPPALVEHLAGGQQRRTAEA
jgi:small-conductance mechanosensitive channel